MIYKLDDEMKFIQNRNLVQDYHQNLVEKYTNENDVAALVLGNFVGEQLNKIYKSNELILQYSEVVFQKIDNLNKYEINFCEELSLVKNYGISNYSASDHEALMQTLLGIYLDEMANIKDDESIRWNKVVLGAARENDMSNLSLALHAIDRFHGTNLCKNLQPINFSKDDFESDELVINGLLNFNGQILVDKYKNNYAVFNIVELTQNGKWLKSPNIYVNEAEIIQDLITYKHKEKLEVTIKTNKGGTYTCIDIEKINKIEKKGSTPLVENDYSR